MSRAHGIFSLVTAAGANARQCGLPTIRTIDCDCYNSGSASETLPVDCQSGGLRGFCIQWPSQLCKVGGRSEAVPFISGRLIQVVTN